MTNPRRKPGDTRTHDPRRSLTADAGAHPVPLAPPAHAGGRGRDARLRGQARRGRGDVGDRGAVARLRLRDVPESRALAHRGPSRMGRAPAAGKGVPEPVCRAILGHGSYTGVPRDTRMAQTLFAVDELCGFLVACA